MFACRSKSPSLFQPCMLKERVMVAVMVHSKTRVKEKNVERRVICDIISVMREVNKILCSFGMLCYL